ncbi:hypothetical protein ABZV75_10130 [Streptomyces flaveolus]|uniref:hypothetical protein n=1 Tax=Streptomyces flaveolus TaxID=67297 RepID=UPI0033B4678F
MLHQLQFIAFLYFRHPLTDGRQASVSRLKTTPSIPTDAHDSHSRTVAGPAADGHSAHGAKSRRAVNTDFSVGHSPAARAAPAPRRANRFRSCSKDSRCRA